MAEKALRKTRTVGKQALLHPLYEALSAMHCGNADRALEVLDRAEGDGTLPLAVVTMARAQCHLLAESHERAHQALAALSKQDLQTPRAIAIRCFCPPLNCTPRSPTSVPYPSGEAVMKP